MKQNKKVEQTILKYFNLVLTVLMLVVLSLNIEQILHNRRIFKPDNYKIFKIANDTSNGVFAQAVGEIHKTLLDECRQCQQLSLRALNRLNGLGVILSLFLSFYSFLFAFKAAIFTKRFFLLVPGCIVVCLITFSYFILVLFINIPKICIDSRVLKENLGCDVDFEYNMNSKVIPLSVLMLVAIPQILVRAMLRVIYRCKHYQVHLKPSSSVLTHVNWHRNELNLNMNAWKEEQDGLTVREALLDTPQEQHGVVFGDRELPVDCELNNDNRSPIITMNQTQNNFYFENMTQNYLILPSESNQIELQTMTKPTIVSTTSNFGNRLYYLRSSLSTISEERTITSTFNEQVELPRSSQMNFIESLLTDIQTNSTLLNEILCVFRPSSKEGAFTRNVPIRFTSPQKSVKKDDGHHKTNNENQFNMNPNMSSSPTKSISSSINSLYSPKKDGTIAILETNDESNNSIERSPNYFQRSPNQKTLVAKKIRFIKRLKNCIETKRGNKLNYLQQIPYLGNEWHKKSTETRGSLFESSRPRSQDIELPKLIESVQNQSNIKLDTSVEPVYF